MKEKTLLRIDRDRLAKQVELQGTLRDSPTTKVNQRGKKGDSKSWSPWPSYRVTQSSPVWSGTDQSLSCRSSVSSQDSAITSICHFEGPSFLTCSDDGSVRLISDISVPSDSQLIGVHEHTFASGLAFHPSSNRVISSGGNGEIKIWNPNPLIEEKPVTVFKEHRSCVWSLDVADEYLLTASLDHTAKLIDLSVGRCRHTLRGHLDSVNKSIFSKKNPDLVYTCSADKSVSLWDCRTAHCSWTLFEHSAAVSDVAVFDLVASCDPSGCVIISDPRMGVLERFPLAMKTNVVTWLGGKLIAVAGSCMQLLTLGTAETPEKIFPASPSEAEIFSLCVSERTALLTSTETGYIQSWC